MKAKPRIGPAAPAKRNLNPSAFQRVPKPGLTTALLMVPELNKVGVGLREVALELREVATGRGEVDEREPAPTREVAGGEDGAAEGEWREVWRRTLRTSRLAVAECQD